MKIKTKYYGIFYKNRGKWTGPLFGELRTMDKIIKYYNSVESYLKSERKYLKKKVSLKQQIWG